MAANNKNNLSFGRYLKNIRLDKGISLQKVSEETRIGIGNLQLIDSEDHEGLPADVFIKGFLRAYAKTIGADGDEAIRLYLASLQDFRETARFESDLAETNSRFWPRLLFSLGALLCFIFMATVAVFFFEKPDDSVPKPISTKMSTEKKSQSASKEPKAPELNNKPYKQAPLSAKTIIDKSDPDPLKGGKATKPEGEPFGQIPEKLLLKVAAVENTWIKVIIDDRVSREYSLKPGESLALEAISGLSLLIGNAGGVQLKLNGKPLKVMGKSGQVVTVRLP